VPRTLTRASGTIDTCSANTVTKDIIDAAEHEQPSPFAPDKVADALKRPDTIDAIKATLDELEKEIENQHPEYEDFRFAGPVWCLVLNHEQTGQLANVLSTGGGAILKAAGVASPAVMTALQASLTYINAVDLLGGNNGVEITRTALAG
jgi:hypothetical protein